MNVYAPANAKNLPVFFWIRMFITARVVDFTNNHQTVEATISSASRAWTLLRS
jgi:hypothetical protein